MAASSKRERRAKRPKSVRERKGKRTARRKRGDRLARKREKSRGWMRAKSGGMSSVSSCLHKAAPHQIAFVLNIWIGWYGPTARAIAGRDATRKRERERIQYPISYARTTSPPSRPLRTYGRKGEAEKGRIKQRAKARREGREREVYDTTRFLGIPQFREPILRLPFPSPSLPNLPNESALRPTSSILPAARYRLPNNLTDCSAPATSGIRVLVSLQNLSEYPAFLTSTKRREKDVSLIVNVHKCKSDNEIHLLKINEEREREKGKEKK